MPNLGAAFGSPSLFLRSNFVRQLHLRIKRRASCSGIIGTLFGRRAGPGPVPPTPANGSGPPLPANTRVASLDSAMPGWRRSDGNSRSEVEHQWTAGRGF